MPNRELSTDLDFQNWAAGRPTARFTDWLREQNRSPWEAAVTHRFVRELADDTLDDAVFRRYLVQDYTFLNSFVQLLGFAIGTAPSLAERIPLAQFLALVTSDENTYFQRAFDALGVAEQDRVGPELLAPARGFRELMTGAAYSLNYEEMLVVLVVAEWSYFTWAGRVADCKPARFYLSEWIEIHANEDFARFVEWLRGQLDREGPKLAPAQQQRVAELFARAIRLEGAFFEAAY